MSISKTLITAALCASLALVGCQSTKASDPTANADPRLTVNNGDFETNDSSYAVSCAVGAGIVGATCLLIADKDKRAVCFAAAAAGCAVGAGSNYLLDNIRRDYHTKEQQLNALIAAMEEHRQKAALMASNAKAVYVEDNNKFKLLAKKIKQKQASKAEVSLAIKRYDANIAAIEQNIAHYQKKAGEYDSIKSELMGTERLTAAERKKLKECDRQIAKLKKSIEDLRGSLNQYAQDRNVLNLSLEDESLA